MTTSAPTDSSAQPQSSGPDVELLLGGMTCASCANRIERKLNKLDGVSASVNYATEKARVSVPEGYDSQQLISTVEQSEPLNSPNGLPSLCDAPVSSQIPGLDHSPTFIRPPLSSPLLEICPAARTFKELIEEDKRQQSHPNSNSTNDQRETGHGPLEAAELITADPC